MLVDIFYGIHRTWCGWCPNRVYFICLLVIALCFVIWWLDINCCNNVVVKLKFLVVVASIVSKSKLRRYNDSDDDDDYIDIDIDAV